MKQNTGFYPRVQVDTSPSPAVGQAGAVLLTDTIRASGLDAALAAALAPWRKPTAVHDPAKIVLDLAVALAVGGDCLADVAVVRGEPGLFGHVASDATVSRLVDTLAGDVDAALAAIDTARAAARAQVWRLAGNRAPDHGTDGASPLIIDLDATLVTAHSDKEQAKPTFKRGYGFHPLCAFLDHGADGTGEPLQILLRPGNAGSNTAADHITVTRQALKQLPGYRAGTPARPQGAGPGRRGRVHPRLPGLAERATAVVLGRVLPARRHRRAPRQDSRAGVDPGLRRPRPDPRRRLGRRTHRTARPPHLAEGDAGHRPQRTTPPRRAAPADRPRRTAGHRVRHQHQPRPAA